MVPCPSILAIQYLSKSIQTKKQNHPFSDSSGSSSVGACEMSQGWGWTCFQALQPFISSMTFHSKNTQTIPTNEPPHSCPLIISTAFPFASKPSHILKQTHWHPGKPYIAPWRNPSPCWASLLQPKSAGHTSVPQPHSRLANIRAIYSVGIKLLNQGQMNLSFAVSIMPFAHPECLWRLLSPAMHRCAGFSETGSISAPSHPLYSHEQCTPNKLGGRENRWSWCKALVHTYVVKSK